MEELKWSFRVGNMKVFGYGETAELARASLPDLTVGKIVIETKKVATLIKSNVFDPNEGKEQYVTLEGEIGYR